MEELIGAQIKKNHFEVLNAMFKVTVCTVKSCQSIPQYTRQHYCSGGGGSLLEASHPPFDILTLSTSVRVFKNIVQNDVKPRSCRLNAQRGKSRRVLLRGNLHRASDTDYTALTCWSDCRSMDFFIALLARESEREFRGVVENSDPKGHCRLETCAVER